MPSYRPKYICNCPFYEKEYKKGICCEAIVNSASDNTMYFKSEEAKDDYVRKNCTKYVPECPLYKVLIKKYETD